MYCAGKRMEYDDPKSVDLVKSLRKNIELSSAMSPLGFIPWLVKTLPGKLLGTDIVYETVEWFHRYGKVAAKKKFKQ